MHNGMLRYRACTLPPAISSLMISSSGLGNFCHRMALTLMLALLALGPVRSWAATSPQVTPPDVLIINSYAPGYEWSDDQLDGILSVFRAQQTEFEPVILYLDYRRFADPAREKWLIEDVAFKCRIRPPRLIITVDDAAFDFALRNRARLGKDIPIVFSGVNHFTRDMIAGQSKITGVSEESDYSGTFELMASLRPRTSHVLVIGNETPSSREKRASFENHAREHSDRYQFEYFEHWTDAELLERVARLPDNWVGLILDVTRDASGKNNYNDAEFSQQLATHARVPIFLTSRPPGNNDWSKFFWDGIGGGMVVATVHGAKAGELALRVLAGEDADAIPILRHSPQVLEVDYRQMEKFGLSLDLLPPGTRVINQPVTFYQVNRSRIILAAGLLLLLCAIIVVLSINILQRKRAEQALHRAEEQLRAAHKLEAIGLLAGGVAHDFNNILQVIRGHAGFLQESLVLSPSQLEDVEIVQKAAERATQLTRQLLAFSRKQPLNYINVDPNALVADMVKMLGRVLGEHIELKAVPLTKPATIVADQGQIEQVLLNLCVNARDSMPAGGRILIELSRTTLTATSLPDEQGLSPGPYLLIAVSDTGCGMPREVLARIFDPFFTTKGPGKGTGMGLAVVYGIVRQHGGTIHAYSEVGKGSVFKVLLPMTGHAPNPIVPLPKVDRSPKEGTILLAEDDPQVRSIAMKVLTRNGFQVLAAADGEEAIALIAQHHSRINLAILDVIMPKRNGRQVFDYIQAHHPNTPVLFCSGYSAEMLPPESAPDSSRALLNKPYLPDQLLHEVHRLLQT